MSLKMSLRNQGLISFCPKDATLLADQKNTCVEIKIRLIYDSLYRIKFTLNEQLDVKKHVVIVKEDNAYSMHVLSNNMRKYLNCKHSIQSKSDD